MAIMKENQFGKKLRELRKEKGISQKDLGEYLNVCNQAVSFWETGSREPDLDTLRDIAKYFDTSVDYLLGLAEF
jgi:transcriptional regulator with XRE-family HTH domain